jgi:hypothetical protein
LPFPFVLYPLLRALRLSAADSASVAAHFGSVSVVTFAVATAALARAGVPHESHAALWVAVMEAPGLLAGRAAGALGACARRTRRERRRAAQWATLAHDVLFGKSVLLLLGAWRSARWPARRARADPGGVHRPLQGRARPVPARARPRGRRPPGRGAALCPGGAGGGPGGAAVAWRWPVPPWAARSG